MRQINLHTCLHLYEQKYLKQMRWSWRFLVNVGLGLYDLEQKTWHLTGVVGFFLGVLICVCRWGNYKQENNLVENAGSELFKLYFEPDCTLALGTPGMIPSSN